MIIVKVRMFRNTMYYSWHTQDLNIKWYIIYRVGLCTKVENGTARKRNLKNQIILKIKKNINCIRPENTWLSKMFLKKFNRT